MPMRLWWQAPMAPQHHTYYYYLYVIYFTLARIIYNVANGTTHAWQRPATGCSSAAQQPRRRHLKPLASRCRYRYRYTERYAAIAYVIAAYHLL